MMPYPIINKSRNFTAEKITRLREELLGVLSTSPYKDKITLITTGSYGRSEASSESDLDCFIIFDGDRDTIVEIANEIKNIDNVINKLIPKQVGDSKTFGSDAIVCFNEMETNIGGNKDTNESLTRRMLFILEGDWLYNETRFKVYRQKLLEKYIKPDTSNEHLPRFFLNDLVRYYRTLTTDFEYKTTENGKAWGLRNIKLRFSRKLLYFGGVIVIAELNELSRDQKIDRATELFSLNAIARIERLGNDVDSTHSILDHYERFLDQIGQPNIRTTLERVTKEDRQANNVYSQLKEASNEFSAALHDWLLHKYPEHPIHHALIF